VRKVLIEDYPDVNLTILIVWLQMYQADSLDEVGKAARLFSDDPRVTQFYDPGKLSGLAVAAGLGAGDAEIAWDIYLFFAGEGEWVDRPPEPQLRGSSWAEPGRLFQGEQLTHKLREIMANLFQNKVAD
jgi:hypothetical protein